MTPWTVAHQAPLFIGFPRQECWSGLPFPSPGDLSNPGIELRYPALQADSLPTEPSGKPTDECKRSFFFKTCLATLLFPRLKLWIGSRWIIALSEPYKQFPWPQPDLSQPNEAKETWPAVVKNPARETVFLKFVWTTGKKGLHFHIWQYFWYLHVIDLWENAGLSALNK